MESSLLLPAFYLPPISYFHIIQQSEQPLLVERFEHYVKQTYRTRTKIATANGILDLIVPILHGVKEHIPMKDIRINYDFNWQRLHWLSIQTAYRSSPYFEYYEDDFARFYEQRHDFLFDFNIEQLQLLLKCMKINRSVAFTETYISPVEPLDYREVIHPKKPSLLEHPKPYYQVFEEKHGFLPDLSVVDLLFNQGPQSKSYL
ncbi:WbqC family protein [Sphingobacterium chuzhouense]|uniref:WbqC family protein n=1 Tax=Sphingobacterium chuzhouense TaxID=1742264 RepID=A0ABR7XQ46_9SPHI|nr:WbqC family protein [Sphingobacterium chuzhouense]MBD1421299.1 WbqC family protein [Sphingobacterium chuzhouense]